MAQELLGVIQEQQLISMTWDTQHISNVLNEILKLFQDQQQRLTAIESQLANFAQKDEVENIKLELATFQSVTTRDIDDIKSQIDTTKTNLDKDIADLREHTETLHIAGIGEAHRLVNVELSNFVPTLTLNDPLLAQMNQNIKENTENISKLLSNAGVSPAVTPTPSTPATPAPTPTPTPTTAPTEPSPQIAYVRGTDELADFRLNQAEKRLDKIEKMLTTYPQIEGDVANLNMALPFLTKRGSKKTKSKPTPAQTNPTPTPEKLTPEPEPKPVKLGEDQIPPSSTTTPAPQPIQEEEDEEDEPAEIVAHTVIDELPPLEAPPPVTIEEPQTPVVATPEKPAETSAPEKEKEERKIVEVHETKTYKTELAPSLRVVSELDWARKVIQQHHDAIRQLQQGLKTQQENFDAMTENIMRANATNNSRISQIAQQQFHAQQDSETVRRQIFEQINHLHQRLDNLGSGTPASEHGSEDEETPKGEKTSGRSPTNTRRKLEKLPPLREVEFATPDADTKSVTQDGKLSANSTTDRTTGRSVTRSLDGRSSRMTRKFTFATYQFSTNDARCKAPTVISTIKTMNPHDNPTRMDFIDITSVSPQTQVRQQMPNLQPVERVWRDGDSRPIERPPLGTKPQPMSSETIVCVSGRIPAKQVNPQFEMTDEIKEMIEEQVTVIARKVVTLLADTARDDVKAQANEMKKTVDKVVSLIDGKIDREFVERMFNKFRVMLTEMNEKIDNVQCSFLQWVTRDELELVLQKFLELITDVKDTAATKAKYHCLLCGRPRNHLAGMLVEAPEGQSRSALDQPMRASLDAPKMRKKPIIPKVSAVDTEKRDSQKPRDVLDILKS